MSGLIINPYAYGGYAKPDLMLTGGSGTVTDIPEGWRMEGFGVGVFGWLDRPIEPLSKKYWEVHILTATCLPGIIDDVVTARNYGGYATHGAGVYGASPWFDSDWGNGGASGSLGGVTAGDVLGFYWDIGGAILKIAKNGSLTDRVFLSFIALPPTVYAHCGFQGGSAEFLLGPDGCQYVPDDPTFTYL